MCFNVSKKFPSELTAKKDIICYKIFKLDRHSNNIISPFQDMIYKPNVLYNIKKPLCLIFDCVIYNYAEIFDGFHSFSSLIKAKIYAKIIIKNNTNGWFFCRYKIIINL